MNELQEKTGNAAVLMNGQAQAMGATDNMTSEDILTPVLWLMQDMSKLVQDDIKKKGAIINSITEETLLEAGSDEKLKFVIVDFFKTRQIFEAGTWTKTESYTSGMDKELWAETVNGIEIQRKIVQNYLVFLLSDVQEVNLGAGVKQHFADPFILKFKGASSTKGKNLNSQLKRFSKFGKPSWFPIFELGTERLKSDKGQYFAWTVSQTGNTEETNTEAASIAAEMLQGFRSNQSSYKIIDVEESITIDQSFTPLGSKPTNEIPF